MELNVIGQESSMITVSDDIFATSFNESLIHQVLVTYQTNARQGSKAQKNRSAVSGGGAKPWRQKGSGRARAGTSRSPIWRTGGVTFAATPKKYNNKVNKKMYRKAMSSIIAELNRQERLKVIDNIEMQSPSTKQFSEMLKSLSLTNVLVVVNNFDHAIFLSARNIPNVSIMTVAEIGPVDLIAHDHLLLTSEALKQFEERLAS